QLAPNLYTDYAHTPAKIRGALQMAHETADDNIVVIYEGLHNTRQHFIKDELAKLFDGVKQLYVVPSYLAREDPKLELLTPEKILDLLSNSTKGHAAAAQLNDDLAGKIRQELDTFRMPVEIKVDTEGNPEIKKILVTGTSSEFKIDTFGRPKPNGITVDPNNNLLKSSPRLRVRAIVARGENLAAMGKYFEANQEYRRALDIQPTNSLAHFRMAEAMFYQKNYQAAANEFRAALGGDLDPKWTEVWSHIYIGKIYDVLGQRERAVNEYTLAQHTKDDTVGAQQEAARYMQKPYGSDAATPAAAAPSQTPPPPTSGDQGEPALKKRTESK
ncbi:MAG: hypothetical protein LAN59_13485, partial [Acidobacteriia bacterium]|nr:hypothetical protein [Terriglobia bacterium]